MWEQIQVNKRNSVLLLIVMALLLVGVGGAIGLAFAGGQGAPVGMLAAAGVWMVLTLVSFSSGDKLLLASSGAVEVNSDVHPTLFNIVEEMKIAANLPAMPKVYIINDPSPNAFATGRNPQNASVAVTAGLLTKLNRDELQGVIAHEVSHIVHRDILFVTLASVMLGSVILLSRVMMHSTRFGSMSSRRYSGSSKNSGAGLFLLLAIVLAILAPIFAQLLYFALSRRREYLADAGAVRLTRYPQGLAGALEKIAGAKQSVATANMATAPMYIANPFRDFRAVTLFSTHPPIQDRIRILRTMAGDAGFESYQNAYRSVGLGNAILPNSIRKQTDKVPVRQGDAGGVESPSPAEQTHQTGDLMRKVNGFEFLTCPCGVKLKLPPNLNTDKVRCPRCKQILSL